MPAQKVSNGNVCYIDQVKTIPLAYSNTDSQVSATKIVLEVLPGWRDEPGEIEFIRFKDGITNTLLKVVKRRPNASEEEIDKHAVLLRAYGNGTEVLIDREREFASHSMLAYHKLAPELLARFENGLIYRFIRGKVCTPSDLQQRPVWQGVARRLAQWHAVLPVASVSTSQQQNASAVNQANAEHPATVPSENSSPDIWTIMQKWILALPVTTTAHVARRDQLQIELERSAAELADTPGLVGNGIVFGHCDLLSANVIIVPSSQDSSDQKSNDICSEALQDINTVAFIDYEYATPSPAAFDLANHFSEWGGFECDYSVLPTRSVRHEFVQSYVNSFRAHTLDQAYEATPADQTEQLMQEVDRFRGIPGLYWGIWALIQAVISQIDFDYATYADIRLKEYFDFRAEEAAAIGREPKEGKSLVVSEREKRWFMT